MSRIQVAPESRLRLMATATVPGFDAIEPDNVRDEPRLSEFGFRRREMAVDGRVNVVPVMEVLVDVKV
jgi:hypothetical protein